jgi:hypothetical protein
MALLRSCVSKLRCYPCINARIHTGNFIAFHFSPYLRRSNQGRRNAAWSQAKIRYLCLQFGMPQTHTTGSGHRSSRLVYLTLYFHAISASSGLRVVAENLEFHLNSWQCSARVVKNTSVTECALWVNTFRNWTVDLCPLSYHVPEWSLAIA